MTINGFSVGKDVTLDFINPLSGGIVPFSNVTSFDSKQIVEKRQSFGISGEVTPLDIPAGWEGSFMLDRNGQGFDTFVSLLEAAYYAGVPLVPSTITETITENDGTISQYQYTKVAANFPEAGKWSGDNKVEQRIDFRASKRVRLV